jgi:uncharacterized protein YaaQ
MKLVIAIVSTADVDELLRRMGARGYRATVIDQRGGFLQQGNVTLFIGVQEALIPDVRRILNECCKSRFGQVSPVLPMVQPGEFFVTPAVETQAGGALYLVLNVERYERVA